MMRRFRRAVAVVAALSTAAVFASTSIANNLHLGEQAPPATLVTFDGRRITTSELRGRVVILTFWATWCVPCRQELPLLSAYAHSHAAEGLTVLAFSLDAPEDLARARQVAQSYRFASGLLASSSAPGYGRIWRIPVNFTIDRKGDLVDDGWKEKQPTWTAERLDRIVTPLLRAAN
jgi:thiol-disulfide isomerase/thioredoxin